MLITMGEMLKRAKKGGYGVAAPNVYNKETVEVCFEAARELKAPIILDCAGVHGVEMVSYLTRFYERKYPDVVAALNLDHGGKYEEIIEAIRAGFTSVMIDRSTCMYDQNVKEVKEIVKVAHSVGVSVEAELGHVGQGFEYTETRDSGLTKPDEAIRFVEETGIDCLAVAVGTSHGTYKGTPKLDFELLKKLNDVIEIPLVLHGGSGTGDENLKKAVKIGIQKINLFTDLSNAGMDSLINYFGIDTSSTEFNKELGEFGNKNLNLYDAFLSGANGYKKSLMYYMTLFGSKGRA